MKAEEYISLLMHENEELKQARPEENEDVAIRRASEKKNSNDGSSGVRSGKQNAVRWWLRRRAGVRRENSGSRPQKSGYRRRVNGNRRDRHG